MRQLKNPGATGRAPPGLEIVGATGWRLWVGDCGRDGLEIAGAMVGDCGLEIVGAAVGDCGRDELRAILALREKA